ncbi:hypothetical protein CAter282_3973 [Collimonas arenae]|uniref:Uncharacterized protein n=1 Tax=Collimonas arenae TaxID=279058 RepID=A0A127QPV6_9BURK|nr:hypothetical protein CAter282_3973 [Collimonas arenae]
MHRIADCRFAGHGRNAGVPEWFLAAIALMAAIFWMKNDLFQKKNAWHAAGCRGMVPAFDRAGHAGREYC